MTPKPKKRKPQKKASPIQSKDIKIIVIDSSKRDKKKQEVKKKGTKKQLSKLQKFQAQMIPQNNVDQIRLQHISSKIQQNYRTQNQSYLLKVKNLYDQYKSLILKYTLLTELDDFTFALDLLRKTIINTFISQIQQSFNFQKKSPIQIIAIDQMISISQKNHAQIYQEEIQTLLKPIFKSKNVDQAYIRLKIMMQQRNILKKLEEKNQLFQNLKDQSLQNCFDNEMGDLHFSALNYGELLEAQQKQELIEDAKTRQSQPLILDGFFKNSNLQNPKQQVNSIRQFLIKPTAKQQMEISKISARSRNQSKESCYSRNDQYFTPFQSNILQLKSMPYQNQNQDVKLQNKSSYLPNLQAHMSRISNMNTSFELPFELESQTSCTPANAKKTMLVQNRPANKIGCEGGCREIDKYSYNSRKQIQNPNLSVNRNDINQSQLFNYQNRSVDFGRSLGFSNLYNSKMFNANNNQMSVNNNNNLQFSKIQSLHASTIVNDWLSESSQSRLVLQQQHMFQQYNWIIFTNENSNMRFSRQINIQNLKLLCVQIDSNFFDDYECILLSDKFKILIMEQKDLVSPEMHMRLGKGDEKGAIQALINKMKIQMQQFMLQYNSRQVIVLIQYQHQFFLRMLIEYIFPQLGQLQEQYKITPFYQIEELQEIIFDLIQTQENIRYDRLIKVPNDLNKFRSKIQNIEFSNLVTMRCLNQLYQTLVQQLTN
ncbi:unnamed protein product (macronuclear) [Paramecium tetraurelia]|uniref:Uncharacterized protein n=1 Tax=Paramecium tetraurelia TaxID=5888 RepID=A0DFJ9_PARTE|nr:uncharacterized protein GSPATT00016629001 [Paramecium tetraurelia]CAK81816.1 unnamed protein product [Paramecium tetraurelia]|eukprot:XP_001449213.1 hypothetical protein (macronuclear) [Paramecium tetraurelia strain d4-2]